MLFETGIPERDQVISRFPQHLTRPKAVIECYANIPCNPCSTSCPFKAISIGEDINNTPVLDFDKCTGCGVCVYSCPGLAIMVVEDLGEKVRFKIPYEFLPTPIPGEVWNAVNRSGEIIGEAIIEKVNNLPKQDRTQLIQLIVRKELLYDFVTIRRKHE